MKIVRFVVNNKHLPQPQVSTQLTVAKYLPINLKPEPCSPQIQLFKVQ